MDRAVRTNSESLWLSLFWEPLSTSEIQPMQMSALRNYLCSTELLTRADPMVALSKGYHLSVWLQACCYKLLHWHPDISERKLAMGLALCFPLCVAPWTSSKLFLRPGAQTSKAEKPIPEKYTSIYVKQHSFQWVFDLKYLRYFSSFNQITCVQITNTASERIHL